MDNFRFRIIRQKFCYLMLDTSTVIKISIDAVHSVFVKMSLVLHNFTSMSVNYSCLCVTKARNKPKTQGNKLL